MTKQMRAVLGSMTAKELKRHISRTNIKRYTRMGKKALIELMIKYKGRFKHLNPDEKIIKRDEKGKPKVKLPEPKYGTDKARTFKRKIPVPSKSVATTSSTASNTRDWKLSRSKREGTGSKTGILGTLTEYKTRNTKKIGIKNRISAINMYEEAGYKTLAPRTSGGGSTWGVKKKVPSIRELERALRY